MKLLAASATALLLFTNLSAASCGKSPPRDPKKEAQEILSGAASTGKANQPGTTAGYANREAVQKKVAGKDSPLMQLNTGDRNPAISKAELAVVRHQDSTAKNREVAQTPAAPH